MNNATNRPDPRDLAAARYDDMQRAERRANALERRADRAAGIETSVEQNARLFKNAGS
jgi:hypothetical protein